MNQLSCALVRIFFVCAVVAAADVPVTVGATVVKTTVKAAGAVVDAITPESKNAKQ